MHILLIDLSALYWRAWFGSAGNEIGAAHQWTVDRIRSLVSGAAGAKVACCCDSGRSFRYDLSADYKANRPAKDPAAMDQLRRVEETLEADGLLMWRAKGFEGDDLIATACRWATENDHHVTIVGNDKDLFSLLSPMVSMRDVATGEVRTPEWLKAKLGIAPEQMRDWLALTGDSSDNVSGVHGIGAKGATKLLQKFGTVAKLYAQLHVADDKDVPPRIKTALQASVANLDLALKLVTLRTDAPIDCAEILAEREAKPITKTDWDAGDSGDDWAPTVASIEVELNRMVDDVVMDLTSSPIGKERMPVNNVTDAEFSTEEPKNDFDPISPPPAGTPSTPPPAPKPTDGAAKTESVSHAGPGPSKALILSPTDPRWSLALEPTDPRSAFVMAKHLYNSRLFSNFPNEDAVLAAILMGRSLGIDMMTILRTSHVIEGKIALHAAVIIGLVIRSGKADTFKCIETTPMKATYKSHRKGDPDPTPTTYTYTIEDANQALLTKLKDGAKPGSWQKIPRTMLRYRCGVELARMDYPEIVTGLYTPDELGAEFEVEPEHIDARVA